jgi:hypothetical protein
MFPLANILLRPLPHGTVGFWDEMLNLVPLVLGAGLLFYLFFSKRKRGATAPAEPADPAPPPPDQQSQA